MATCTGNRPRLLTSRVGGQTHLSSRRVGGHRPPTPRRVGGIALRPPAIPEAYILTYTSMDPGPAWHPLGSSGWLLILGTDPVCPPAESGRRASLSIFRESKIIPSVL
eukprot:3494978-Rhodomonas_salina.2